MTSVIGLTEPYANSLRPVPHAGPGVCDVCHSGPGAGWPRCYSCKDSTARVTHPVTRIAPISLMTKSSEDQLYHLLRSYKGYTQTHMQIARVAGLIGRHLNNHGTCITGGTGWDLLTTVPSTRGKTDHPLAKAVRALAPLRDDYADLLAAHKGPFDRIARDDMFIATRDLGGERVLLIDDTFTSGARVQSAASALGQAGAEVVGAMVVGRIIDPTYNEACESIWAWSTERTFDFERCALCAPSQLLGA